MGFAFPISIFSVKRTMQFIIFKASCYDYDEIGSKKTLNLNEGIIPN